MHRKNNFDFLRLLLASFVIITHSYSLSGIKECDSLCLLTDGQISFSDLGVKGFFVISGFLIFQSFERSNTISNYYWKRILRLFPGLFVVLLLTVLLAPFVYDGKVFYLLNKSVWTYIPRNLSLYRLQHNINGVFESNPYKSAINGSLWTIPYEFTMYVLISFFFVIKNKKWIISLVLTLSFLLTIAGNIFFINRVEDNSFLNREGSHFFSLSVFFIAGSLLSILHIEKLKNKNLILFFSFCLLVLSIYLHVFFYFQFIALPLFFILFGIQSIPVISNLGNSIGDLSYGLYIYGFPVQQTLEYYFKFNYLELMIFSMIICYFLAYLSWHLIENKALQFKKMSFRRFLHEQKSIRT